MPVGEDDRSLAAVFLAEAGQAASNPAIGGTAAELEADLHAACERGRRAHVDLDVDDVEFVRRLAGIAARRARSYVMLSDLPIEDLYLAHACVVARDSRPASEVHVRYGPAIRAAIERLVPRAEVAEVEQTLLDRVLVSRPGCAPKIATYDGRASLARWLEVGAQRAALMWLRARRAERRGRERAAAEPLVGEVHPELGYLKERYREDVEEALKQALCRLPPRERAVLRLHVVNGLSLVRVGAMFGVTHASASRWLARARDILLDDVKAILQQRLRISPSEAASLARLIASNLELNLSTLLRGD